MDFKIYPTGTSISVDPSTVKDVTEPRGLHTTEPACVVHFNDGTRVMVCGDFNEVGNSLLDEATTPSAAPMEDEAEEEECEGQTRLFDDED